LEKSVEMKLCKERLPAEVNAFSNAWKKRFGQGENLEARGEEPILGGKAAE